MSRSGRLAIGWAVLVAWCVLLFWWASTPLTESQQVYGPDGKVFLQADGSELSIEFECSAPARSSSQPAAALPEGGNLARTPCERTHSDNAALLWINVGVVILAGAGLAFVMVRTKHEPTTNVRVATSPSA